MYLPHVYFRFVTLLEHLSGHFWTAVIETTTSVLKCLTVLKALNKLFSEIHFALELLWNVLQGTQYHFATLMYLHACFFHDAVLFNKPASAMKENHIAYSTSCWRVICKMQWHRPRAMYFWFYSNIARVTYFQMSLYVSETRGLIHLQSVYGLQRRGVCIGPKGTVIHLTFSSISGIVT